MWSGQHAETCYLPSFNKFRKYSSFKKVREKKSTKSNTSLKIVKIGLMITYYFIVNDLPLIYYAFCFVPLASQGWLPIYAQHMYKYINNQTFIVISFISHILDIMRIMEYDHCIFHLSEKKEGYRKEHIWPAIYQHP